MKKRDLTKKFYALFWQPVYLVFLVMEWLKLLMIISLIPIKQ